MKRIRILTIIFALTGILYSCNSPMDIESPRDETPIGRIAARIYESDYELNGQPADFKIQMSKIAIDLSNNPPLIWIDSLHFITQSVNSDAVVDLKGVYIHLDKSNLINGIIDLPGDSGAFAKYFLNHNYDPNLRVIDSSENNGYNFSELTFEINKEKKEIFMVLNAKIYDDYSIKYDADSLIIVTDPITGEKYEVPSTVTKELIFKDSLFFKSKFKLKY